MKSGQALIVQWDEIKANFPSQLKVSHIAMVPHKSRKWRVILDLSYHLRLKSGRAVPSVGNNTEKTVPQRGVDQLGHSLERVIYVFVEAEPDEKICMAK